MALLLGKIDANTIWIIKRWCSKNILRYLHVPAGPLLQGHAATMVVAEDYTLIPAATFQPSAVIKPAG